MTDISQVDDSKMLCILAGVGGGGPQEVRDKVAHYHEKVNLGPDARLIRFRKSAEELAEYIGKEFYSYIASETGGGNGVLPMYLNAVEGKPSVDADCCARAPDQLSWDPRDTPLYGHPLHRDGDLEGLGGRLQG